MLEIAKALNNLYWFVSLKILKDWIGQDLSKSASPAYASGFFVGESSKTIRRSYLIWITTNVLSFLEKNSDNKNHGGGP